MAQDWERYERAARELLDRFAAVFKIDRFEGKQSLPGLLTSTDWEIDAKGVRDSDGGVFIVECRRYTKSKQSQEKVGSLAFRILDTGSVGGIVVSPLGLQEGAEKVARAANIISVKLDAESTSVNYMMQYLNRFFVGVSGTLFIEGAADATVERAADEIAKADDSPGNGDEETTK